MRVWITWRDEKMNKNVEFGYTFSLKDKTPEEFWSELKDFIGSTLRDNKNEM